MERRLSGPRSARPAAAALAVAVAAVLACALAALCPARAALAADRVAYSEDASGNVTSYYSVSDALNAGYGGAVVIMDADWTVDGLEVPVDKKITIDMHGHTIKNAGDDATITVKDRAELTLTASAQATFSSRGYSGEDGSQGDYKVTSGGLVTNTSNRSAIDARSSSKLTLDGVAVVGCSGQSDYGAVNLHADCAFAMTNGATVEHNKNAWYGGGIYVGGGNTTVTLDGASVSGNYAKQGGGIYVAGEDVTIVMAGGAKVDGNAAQAGGGIFFSGTGFSLKSEDGEAFVSNNKAVNSSKMDGKSLLSGGGIHVDQKMEGSNKGLIEGITISGNYSAYDGGGIELDQENTTVRACTITGNTTNYEGGGIYVCNDDNAVDGCILTGNASDLAGKGYEGGGIYVSYEYDVKMSGVCLVYGNTRGKDSGNADDVFLRENPGATAKAYITGGLAQGSKVGVRTGITGDRRVASGFKPESNDCLFMDLGGYYVSYGDDKGGDAWQRHTTKEFAAQVNGEGSGKYRNGTTVTLVAPLTKGDNQVFWYWDASSTTGLYPVADYITSDGALSNVLTFEMPQNAVNAVAVYATRVKKVLVAVKAPAAGEQLPATAEVRRYDAGVGGTYVFTVPVSWYEVGEDGTETAASGTAKAGTAYVARLGVAESSKYGLHFSVGISAQDVTVITGADLASGTAAASASVDASTGALSVLTGRFETEGEAVQVEGGSVTVRLEDGGLLGSGSTLAQALALDGGDEAAQAAMTAGTDSGDGSADGLVGGASLGSVEVSYAEGSELVTLAAPAVAGYNFCNWEGVKEGWLADDVEGALAIPASDLSEDLEVTAIYTPVVTSAEIGMAAPAVGGELAASVPSLKVVASDGTEADLAELVSPGAELEVAWEPADGTAARSTAYTAWVKVADAEGLEGVDKVLSPSAAVTAGGVEAASARFEVKDGALYFVVTFPATARAVLESVSAPAEVGLTFAQALAASRGQGSWGLPGTVSVTLDDGSSEEATVSWGVPEGFDGAAAGEQALTATGTVCLPEGVEAGQVSLEVVATVRVAAPERVDAPTADPEPGTYPDPVSVALSCATEGATILYTLDGSDPLASGFVYDGPVELPGATTVRAAAVADGMLASEVVSLDYTVEVPIDPEPATGFADVEAGSWYETWVYQAASLGLMTGYSNADGSDPTLFGPADDLTRGQVATVLWRMAGSPAGSAAGFSDVDAGEYYARGVAWCQAAGIVTGYTDGAWAGAFRPEASVTREELATMVYRFARWAGVKTLSPSTAALDACSDAASVSAWAHDAAVWCAAAGVMTGKDTGGAPLLDPQATASRAEAAKMFVRLAVLASGSEEPYADAPAEAAQAAVVQTATTAAAERVEYDDVAEADGDEANTPAAGTAGTDAPGDADADAAADGGEGSGQPTPDDVADADGSEAASAQDGTEPAAEGSDDADADTDVAAPSGLQAA